MVSNNYTGNNVNYSPRQNLTLMSDINFGIYSTGNRRDALDYQRGNDGERIYRINRLREGDYSGSERRGASPMFLGGIGEISVKGILSGFGDGSSN